MRDKVYSSRVYWNRTKNTRQDLVYLNGTDFEEIESFGPIVIFLYNRRNNTVRVLVEEYNSSDPFELLHNLVNHNSHMAKRIALQLMRCIRDNNNYFRVLTGNVSRLRCASIIRGPCCLMKYGNQTFVSRL